MTSLFFLLKLFWQFTPVLAIERTAMVDAMEWKKELCKLLLVCDWSFLSYTWLDVSNFYSTSGL